VTTEAAPNPKVRLLSIDGGGIRGIIPAMILTHIEEVTQKPIHELFHLIGGTSTGGILCLGLAAGIPAKKLLELYTTRGAEVFPDELTRNVVTSPMWAKYGIKKQEAVLKEVLGDRTLADTLVPTLIASYELNSNAPFFFKSWLATDKFDRGSFKNSHDNFERYNFKLVDVARATAAAPTYFPVKEISHQGQNFRFVDGGLHSNDPSLAVYSDSIKFVPNGEVVQLLSIGTGREIETPIEVATDAGWGRWAQPLVKILLDTPTRVVEYQLTQIFANTPSCYTRVQPILLKRNAKMDNISSSNIDELCAIGREQIKSPGIQDWLKILKDPRPNWDDLATAYPKQKIGPTKV